MSIQKKKPDPEKNEKGLSIITEKYCSELSEYNGYYYAPHLNRNLYLHFKGFHKIENLDNFINVKVLYLESNCIKKIENLNKLVNLTCLYLQNNYITKIENLDENKELRILNFIDNKITIIENLGALTKLENFYIEKNQIASADGVKGILECPSMILLDIQSNLLDDNPDELIDILSQKENLRVLYLKGNDVIRKITNYRRTMILKFKNLTYLDDRPVREEDRVASEAYLKGGYQAEIKAREEYRMEHDKVYHVRKAEKEMLKVSFEERKRKALESLTKECEQRKNELEDKKRILLKEYEEYPEKRNALTVELSSVDYQIEENNRFRTDEENDVISSMSKREKVDQYSNFIYEEWMDDVIEVNVIENLFDFSRALQLIQLEFKLRNVKNWELFNILDLRNKWTEFELKKYRTGDDNVYLFTKAEIFPEESMKQKKDKEISQYNNQSQLNTQSIKISEEKIDSQTFDNTVKQEGYDSGKDEQICTKSKVKKEADLNELD